MARAAFKIHGMDCAEEVATLRRELSRLSGVEGLEFHVLDGKMAVTFVEQVIRTDDLIAAVDKTGMRAEPWQEQRTETKPGSSFWSRQGRLIMTIASGVCTAFGLMVHVVANGWRAAITGHELLPPPLARIIYLIAVAAGAWYVAPKAWLAVRRLRPDMNLLMVVAVVGAMLIGEYFEAATVAFLFALSLLLESWSVARARRAVAALMAITPPQARVLRGDGREELVLVENVALGTHIVVRPGERFPLDGRVTKGQTSVNQAPITGESMAVSKEPGSDVFAGTINGDGAVEFEATKHAQDTTLARIIRMVSEAQARRAPSEQWVERFARYYTPAIMLLALLVAVVPPLMLGASWSKWFYESLVLLVIGCPCALVISTPVSIVAGLTAAARNGVLIKGGMYLELPARLKVIAMDKTGTLTEGRPQVHEIVALSGHDQREVLEIAASIEARSEHPLARAIVRHATAEGLLAAPAEKFQAIKGKGASAELGGRPVWIGSHRFLEERGQETPEMHDRLESLSKAGSSVVVVGNDQHVCGLIAVGDQVRPDAKRAVEALKHAGVHRVIMLSGDNQETAAAVALTTGVDEVRAELLPEDKVSAVEELVWLHGVVAMVGDGVNDAPAMARSSLGIAMGAMGTDAAIETADVALMSDDLSRLPWLIHHSRRTLSIIHQNIAASLGVKAVFVLLTFAGHASLWAAIAADMGVSLIVVFNALRLLSQGRSELSAT